MTVLPRKGQEETQNPSQPWECLVQRDPVYLTRGDDCFSALLFYKKKMYIFFSNNHEMGQMIMAIKQTQIVKIFFY